MYHPIYFLIVGSVYPVYFSEEAIRYNWYITYRIHMASTPTPNPEKGLATNIKPTRAVIIAKVIDASLFNIPSFVILSISSCSIFIFACVLDNSSWIWVADSSSCGCTSSLRMILIWCSYQHFHMMIMILLFRHRHRSNSLMLKLSCMYPTCFFLTITNFLLSINCRYKT